MKENAYSFLRKQIESSIPSKFKNQKELADFAGISQANLNAFLNGKRAGMSFETAYKILTELGISLGHSTLPPQDQDESGELELLRTENERLASELAKEKIESERQEKRADEFREMLGYPSPKSTFSEKSGQPLSRSETA